MYFKQFLFAVLFCSLTGLSVVHNAKAQPHYYTDHEKDSTIHRYANGKISVVRTPWINGERKTKLYCPKGELTYTIHEARLSYTVSADLKFHPNGAVESANVFTNPGASRFMYSSTIHFSKKNEPEWKVSKQTPALTIRESMGDKFLWDKNEKRWEKQPDEIWDTPQKK